jgi:hypothetical protein
VNTATSLVRQALVAHAPECQHRTTAPTPPRRVPIGMSRLSTRAVEADIDLLFCQRNSD